MYSSRKLKSSLFNKVLFLFCLSSLLISCSKTELPKPEENGSKENSFINLLEGPWNTSDNCNIWTGTESYTTDISIVEYNIIEFTNAFNLVAPSGEKATIHISVMDDDLIIPFQSFIEDRYDISGSGSMTENGDLIFEVEIIDGLTGDPIHSCSLNLSR